MFSGCMELESVNIEDIRTDSCENFRAMFENCTSLKQLNLNNFNISKGIRFSFMFCNCIGLKTINIEKWVFQKNRLFDFEGMFLNCKNLVGLNTEVLKDAIKQSYKSDVMFARTKYEDFYCDIKVKG